MISRITNWGVTSEMTYNEVRRQKLSNHFYILAFFACLINVADIAVLGVKTWIVLCHCVVVFIPLVLYYFNRIQKIRHWLLDIFITVACGWIFFNASIFGPGSGIQYFYFPTLMFLFILVNPKEKARLSIFTLIITGCFFALEWTNYSLLLDEDIPAATIHFKYYLMLSITLIQTVLASIYTVKTADDNETMLEHEKQELFILNAKLDGLNNYIEQQNNSLKSELQQKAAELLEHQKELNSALIEAEEKERKRLSRDLHDGLGLLLSTAKIKIQTVDYSNLEKNESLTEALDLIDKSCIELRLISQNLTPTLISEIGIVASIDSIVHSINTSKYTNVEFVSFGIEKINWKGEDEVKIYRLILELINNCVKHANAKLITVQLIYDGTKLQVLVEDNGRGIDSQNTAAGSGLRNMKGFVELYNGNYTIDSKENKGTLIVIEIPYA